MLCAARDGAVPESFGFADVGHPGTFGRTAALPAQGPGRYPESAQAVHVRAMLPNSHAAGCCAGDDSSGYGFGPVDGTYQFSGDTIRPRCRDVRGKEKRSRARYPAAAPIFSGGSSNTGRSAARPRAFSSRSPRCRSRFANSKRRSAGLWWSARAAAFFSPASAGKCTNKRLRVLDETLLLETMGKQYEEGSGAGCGRDHLVARALPVAGAP